MVAEPHPYVVGFGMGGDEAKFTPADFAPAYRLAHDKGLAAPSMPARCWGRKACGRRSATCR